ncbi:NUDIX domain-containing protein [candidate division WWE3 bacterium]|uniref:NUDIX domain-containing protein n=1 Tax=candidate division WWE3 bacterium TaxID=2053526 RepID=A0A955LHB7_UNCKA|nr:NUDIX domain-containing protein [candidate division WWE3 bacterium]
MPDELLDLVDENDVVIGTILRSEANSNPHVFHREIGVLIVDSKKRVLMQQRSATKKTYPLYWIVSCAGHVPAGMSPEDAAHKELQEELGFDTALTFVEKYALQIETESIFAYMYQGVYEGQTIVIDPDETEQYRFFSRDEWQTLIDSGAQYDDDSSRIAFEYWDAL